METPAGEDLGLRASWLLDLVHEVCRVSCMVLVVGGWPEIDQGC